MVCASLYIYFFSDFLLGSLHCFRGNVIPFSFSEISPGDNFFKPATYVIEAMFAKSFEDSTEKLKEIEAQILAKRNDLRQFEVEYRKVRILHLLVSFAAC